MNVTLMPNMTREHAYETTKELCRQLDAFSINYNFYGDIPPEFKLRGTASADERYLSDKTDVIIAVGGDGTMIRAAKLALKYSVPVLGVNAGKLAYLMGLESNETELIGRLPARDYTVEERLVLKIDICGENGEKLISDYCINDTVLRSEDIRLVSFDLYCDSGFINRYTADGLIISTPTGSTAYNLAAGGPIVDPRVESIILSPICPHSLTERTVIFSADSVLRILNPKGNPYKTLLSCDGGESIEFSVGCSVHIEKADKKAKFIHLKDDTFLDILHKKMITK